MCGNRTFWRSLGVILLLILLFDGLYLYRSWSKLMTARTAQAQLLAQTVVESLASNHEDEQKIRNQLQKIAFGSVHYAQFVHQGEVRVDIRSPEVLNLDLEPLGTDQLRPQTQRLWTDGLLLVDTITPLSDSHGYIRVGVSLNTVLWGILQETAFVAGVSLAALLGLSLLLAAWLLWRTRHRTETSSSAEEAPAIAWIMPDLSPAVVRLNGFLIDDSQKMIITDDGHSLTLPPKEYCLIRFLASQPGRVFSEEEIRRELWPEDRSMTRKDTTHYIYLLRKRLRENGVQPDLIENVRGHGYKISI